LVRDFVDRQQWQVDQANLTASTMGSYFANEQRKQLVCEGLAPATYRATRVGEELRQRRGQLTSGEILPRLDDIDPFVVREALHQWFRLVTTDVPRSAFVRLLRKPQREGWEAVQADLLCASTVLQWDGLSGIVGGAVDYFDGLLKRAAVLLLAGIEAGERLEEDALDYWPPELTASG